MKKLSKISILLFTIVTMLSCGGRNKIKLQEPPTDLKYDVITKVDGELSDVIEVVEGSYNFEISKEDAEGSSPNYSCSIKVKFRVLKSQDISASSYDQFGPLLVGSVLDDKGSPLKFELSSGYNNYDAIAGMIKKGSGESWISFNIQGQGSISNQDDADKIFETYLKGKKIQFNSEIRKQRESTSSSSSNETSSSSGGNCDEFLEGYKKFMTDYIEVMKKYKENPQDADIIEEYSKIMGSATKWATKSKDCQSDPAIAAKVLEIQAELAKAITN